MKELRFNFKGYYDVCEFTIKTKTDIQLDNYNHISFSSKTAQNKIFKFYKIEMQQGEKITAPNYGKRYIEMTGFYDLYPKRPSWAKFQNEVCPKILYSFEIKDGVILITPNNIKETNEIRDKILML